jgi:hypothetical protein
VNLPDQLTSSIVSTGAGAINEKMINTSILMKNDNQEIAYVNKTSPEIQSIFRGIDRQVSVACINFPDSL